MVIWWLFGNHSQPPIIETLLVVPAIMVLVFGIALIAFYGEARSRMTRADKEEVKRGVKISLVGLAIALFGLYAAIPLAAIGSVWLVRYIYSIVKIAYSEPD